MNGDSERILFVTSNGTGLGHLTRSLAIARRLPERFEPLVLTLSAAAPVVERLGLPVEYVASYERPGAGTDISWTFRTRERFRAAVAEARPAVVVFDGTHPYERLLPALRAAGARLVWCRRAMWRPQADTAPLWRTHLFDHVLEPGELAAAADEGPTAPRRAEAEVVEPIVLLDRAELLPRTEAERALGLKPGDVNVLVQLGQGPGVREANARVLRHLAGRDVRVVAAASALADVGEVPDGVLALRAEYPLARFFAAFDAAVAAAGYNAFHELVALGVPTLFVPMERQTDDQAARARAAQERGLGLACDGPDDPALESRLDQLLERREELAAAQAGLPEWRGAAQAARWLEDRVAREAAAQPQAVLRRRPSVTVRARRWWIFAASVPRTVARVVRQRLRRPRPRTLVLALGVAPPELRPRLEALLARTKEAPERVLVVTDALEFRMLLDLGVGFEHVPPRGSRQAELSGLAYEEFARRRLALITARRPRFRRTVELTSGG